MTSTANAALAALLLLGPAAAMAEDPPASTGEDKKICRQFDQTGSIKPLRVCLTRTEWAAFPKTMAKRRLPLVSYTPIQLERGL